jgi:hypothetical protein
MYFRSGPTKPNPGFLPGAVSGARQDLDVAAEALARGAGDVAHWAGLTGWTPGKDVAASDAQNQTQRQEKYGTMPGYQTGEMVGNFAASIPAAEAAGPALGLIPGVARISNAVNALAKLNRGVDLATLPARTLVKGLAPGAAAGAVTSQRNPGSGALTGAVIGGSLGGLVGTIPLVGTLGRWMLSAPIRAVAEKTAPAGQRALNTVAKALFDRGVTPAQAAKEIATRGPNAMLADLPELRGLTKGVINQAGPGATFLRGALEDRAAGAEDRVTKAVKAATGGGDIYGTSNDLKAARTKAAAPLFASLNRIKPTQVELNQVSRFINAPEGQSALKSGLITMRRQSLAAGLKFDPKQYGLVISKGGKMSIAPGYPSMPLLHAIKEGFDDMVEKFRDPVTGKMDPSKEVGALDDVRSSYRRTLTGMYPRYQSALDAWSGPTRSDAVQMMGRRALRNDPEVTAKIVSGLSSNDKVFFLNGIARALLDKIGNNAESVPDARTIFGNTAIRAKIQAALGPGETFNQFAKEMQQELNIAASNRAYLANSATAENEAAKKSLASGAKGFMALITGNHLGALRHAIDAAGAASDEPYLSELAKVLGDTNQVNSLARLMKLSPTARIGVSSLAASRNALAASEHGVGPIVAGALQQPNGQ